MPILKPEGLAELNVTGTIVFACCGRPQSADVTKQNVIICTICLRAFRLTAVEMFATKQTYPPYSTVVATADHIVTFIGHEFKITMNQKYRVGHDITGFLWRPGSTLIETTVENSRDHKSQKFLVPFPDEYLRLNDGGGVDG